MPVGAFVPSRIHLDYPEWQAPLIGNVGQVWAYDGTGYVPTSFLLSSAVSAYGATLIDDADAATARTTLGLGTAATLNVGTSANNIVQLDGSARLPAVDGSQLTGITAAAAGSTTQVIYNASGVYAGDAGLTYNASTDRLTVVGGIIAGDWSPPSDSTTAFSIWDAARTTRVVTVDTTNSRTLLNTVGGGTSLKIAAFQHNGTDRASVVYDSVNNHTRINLNTNYFIDTNLSIDWSTKFRVPAGAGMESSRYAGNTWIVDNNPANTANQPVNIIRGAVATDTICLRIDAQGTTNSKTLQIYNGSEQFAVWGDGRTAIGGIIPTALLDIAASTTTRASLRVRAGAAPTTPNAGDIWDDGSLVAYNIDATTNAVVNSLKLRRGSSGTPTAGFGLGIAARLESSTTEDQDAGRLTYEWVTATHASRASRGKLTAYYTSTEQEAMTWDGGTGGLKLAFYGGTPVARQVLATGAGATVDDVITALQNLGLLKQS